MRGVTRRERQSKNEAESRKNRPDGEGDRERNETANVDNISL